MSYPYYYRKRKYRSWRSRGHSFAPSKYAILTNLFGEAIGEIRRAFLNLDDDALDEMLSDYGSIYGESAETYARKTFPQWKSGATNLSGQTMERLVELVPPYLTAEIRFSLLQLILKKHKKNGVQHSVRINVKEPYEGFRELSTALNSMSHDYVLAHLPENVMKAASWLYDDDITSARSMLAEVERLENDMIRSKATREIELLRRTISSGQVQSASYSVEMPSGTLDVVAFAPSQCFVATVCFGENAPQTKTLRHWRDTCLIDKRLGRMFVVWYYANGEKLAEYASRHIVFKLLAKSCIGVFAKFISIFLKGKQ